MNPNLHSGLTAEEKGIRQPVRVYGFALLSLSFQTLGIVHPAFGTSPIYTLNGIWPASGPIPNEEDVIGGVSAVLWALTLVALLKYVFFALYFGTAEGEGGPFALFHGIYPPKAIDYEGNNDLTTDFASRKSSGGSATPVRPFLGGLKWIILVWALFGTALTVADGMLTPAVSVTSAVAGIALSVPNMAKDIGVISIGFLVALFLIQRFGTAKASMLFSPIMFLWTVALLLMGIYDIVLFPGILRALDLSRAVMWFVRTGNCDYLAGVILALTGCEAMFANLGQFNKLSIQLSFSLSVYPSLVLAYLGQGARLITDGEAVIQNIFFAGIPGGTGSGIYWFIVASQAIITATFSLFQQVINMKSLPPLRMRHTSQMIQGQIYIPSVNWVLCAGTIMFVLIFPDPSHLTNAYGFAVAIVMFVTTTLISIQISVVKHLHWIFSLIWLVFFGFLDALFWGASLKKVPAGASAPLAIGFVVAAFTSFWTWAKGLEDEFDGANRRNLRQFISKVVSEKSMHTHSSLSPRAAHFEDEDLGGRDVLELNPVGDTNPRK